MKDKPSILAAACAQIYIGLMLWLALMAIKAVGIPVRTSWAALGLGVIWVPVLMVVLLFAKLAVVSVIRSARLRIGSTIKRYRTKKALSQAINNYTINGVGAALNIKRHSGETSSAYMARIKKITNVSPVALSTLSRFERHRTLNCIGPLFGVIRNRREHDADYERRILHAAATTDKVMLKKVTSTDTERSSHDAEGSKA